MAAVLIFFSFQTTDVFYISDTDLFASCDLSFTNKFVRHRVGLFLKNELNIVIPPPLCVAMKYMGGGRVIRPKKRNSD